MIFFELLRNPKYRNRALRPIGTLDTPGHPRRTETHTPTLSFINLDKSLQTYGSIISFEGIDEFYRLIPIFKMQTPEGGSCPPPGPPQFCCGNQHIRSKIHLNGSLYSEFEENR